MGGDFLTIGRVAYKDPVTGEIVSGKGKKKLKTKEVKAVSYRGKYFRWIVESFLFEGKALSEPKNGKILIEGINRSRSLGQPKFKGEVEVSIIKEESYED